MTIQSTDVFVIGGGPAGLAVAIACRQRGLDVTVADAQWPSIDKACGEGLLPDAAAALRELGVRFDPTEIFTFRGIRFLNNEDSAAADFPGGARGLGVRRTTLHLSLLRRCEQLGATCLWGQPVLGWSGNDVTLKDRKVRTQWIVGADGAQSLVRRWARLAPRGAKKLRFAFRQHFAIAPWSEHVEGYWSPAGQIYVTPVAQNQVGVALISRDPKLRVQQALPWFPGLATRLAKAPVISRERGAITGMRKLRRVWRDNIALAGDASGTVDAITGEGLGLAFRQAISVADCLHTGSLANYGAAHERISRQPRLIGSLLLALDGRPRLQQRTLRVFRRKPEVFERMLALHIGNAEASLARGTLAMGWSLLTT